MYTVSVVRPDGVELRIHSTTRASMGDVIVRETARGSEIIEVEFPDE